MESLPADLKLFHGSLLSIHTASLENKILLGQFKKRFLVVKKTGTQGKLVVQFYKKNRVCPSIFQLHVYLKRLRITLLCLDTNKKYRSKCLETNTMISSFLLAVSVYYFSIEVSVIYSSSFLGLCPKCRACTIIRVTSFDSVLGEHNLVYVFPKLGFFSLISTVQTLSTEASATPASFQWRELAA